MLYKAFTYAAMVIIGTVFVAHAHAPMHDPYEYFFSTLYIVEQDLKELSIKRQHKQYEEEIREIRREWNEDYFWYAKMPEEYRGFIIELNENLNVPPRIIYYLVHTESRWYPRAVGQNHNSRDYGLMQLNSNYMGRFVKAHFSGSPENFNPHNGKHSLEVGLKHLDYLHDRFDGNWLKALQAYNAGAGRVERGYIPASTKRYARYILYNDDSISA